MLGLSSITSLPDGRAGLTPVADKAEDVDEVPSPEHSPPIAGGGEGGWGGGGGRGGGRRGAFQLRSVGRQLVAWAQRFVL